ncbi:MAG TPA: ABC transporter permease [Vicinamibacterales bacterium]|nr:ABC transporter permease [Vicinamibacterales bacterium]
MPDPSTGSGSPSTGSGAVDWTPALAARLSSLRLAPAREAEIVDELSQHLDDVYGEKIAAGATHDEAMRSALEELDEGDLLTSEMRPLRQASAPVPITPGTGRGRWFADMLQDIRYAMRTLRAARGWAMVIVLLLGLGIGTNAAIFSATDELLLSRIPGVQDPGGLVRLRWTGRNATVSDYDQYGHTAPGPNGARIRSSFSYAAFSELAKNADGRADLFACAPFDQTSLVVDGRAELAWAFAATGNYFTVLGVRPVVGRLFGPGDDRRDAPGVAVIGYRYWRTRFGADPGVVGKNVLVRNVPVTIVGVTPPAFAGVEGPTAESPDITFPVSMDARLKGSSGGGTASYLDESSAYWLEIMGRLAPGVSSQQLQSRLAGAFQQIASPESAARPGATGTRDGTPTLLVQSGRRGVYDVDAGGEMAAAVLSVVVAIILLIICANIGNLMLSRAVARQKEMSIRLSLGATRARLLRQLFTEAVLLAIAGSVLGLFVASWAVRLLSAAAGDSMDERFAERAAAGVFHWHTLGFIVAVGILATIAFAVVPALSSTRIDLGATLKDASRAIAGHRSLTARALLVSQVTLSAVLLVGAGLFLRTVADLAAVEVGFDPANLLLIQIIPTVSGYDHAQTLALYTALLDRLAALPGVRGATLSQPALLSGSTSSTNIFVKGRSYPESPRIPPETEIDRLVVSPDFFEVIGISVVAGRPLTRRDDEHAPRVAVVNEAAARSFFPGVNPIGRRFGGSRASREEVEVVGVVRDTKYANLRQAPPPTIYETYLQVFRGSAWLAVRTAGPPAALASTARDAIREVAPTLPLAKVTTEMDDIDERFAPERLFAESYAVFGGMALLLASIGLFGLMSYNVARRTAEMGVRMALGAQRADVLRLVMRESMALVVVGLAAGLAIALATGRLIASLLFGVPSADAVTFTMTALVMIAVCGLAAYLPARRASRVDPVTALRCE